MSHTHVTVSDELIEHEHDDGVHWHHQRQFQPGQNGTLSDAIKRYMCEPSCTSVYYPPQENGEPDPRGHGACEKAIESLRQGLTVYQPLAGQMQDRAEKAEGLLAEATGLMRDTAMGRHLMDNEMHLALFEECTEMLCAQARAFLSRPEIKERK